MTETCIACAKPFVDGDEFLPDISGGFVHEACCGDDGFVDLETGEPLAAKPTPLIWSDDQ